MTDFKALVPISISSLVYFQMTHNRTTQAFRKWSTGRTTSEEWQCYTQQVGSCWTVPLCSRSFADGSTYVVDSPGYLPGHFNLLCRIGPRNWIYLGGDACHDIRLLMGEKEVATWKDADGQTLCIHLDKESAEKTIRRIAQLKNDARASQQHVEVIMAHDAEWLEIHRHELFPARFQC